MTEQVQGIQPASAGQPTNASGAASPKQQTAGEQQGGQQYATLADVERVFNDLFSRKAQSISDMTAAKVQRIVDKLADEGVRTTPDKVRELISSQQPAQSNPATSTGQPAQVQQGGSEEQPEELPPVLATAYEMMTEADIFIEDDDPELQTFGLKDWDKAKKVPYLQKVEAAIEAKRTRLAQAGDPARMPSLSGGTGGAGGGKAAIVAELTKLLHDDQPSQHRARIKELKSELEKYN